ncbi:hypothetical protein [Mycetocola zhadangensis]|uniref:Uncharacterized protein n=1 Tax=Mycetocola zhadangensis TaxID=1164595 RepID=A0A3L7J1U1_9MICO|nr:hypothetical protein [Mycetocola zhadangensis]RLQ84477.1 hypothetical protein D9V28_09835 [Mycetocola zhadangensis]GGE92666.1 hypothetical protein GCM10011313_14530 [Mycetocola zhadangensis]
MTIHTKRLRGSKLTLLSAIAALAVVFAGMPAATTDASLTSAEVTKTGASGVGNWCSVPNPTAETNVYKVSEFPTLNAPEGSGATTAVQMIIVPVIDDASFAPVQSVTAAPNQVGIRLWSCSDLPAVNSTSLKMTSWRSTSYEPSRFVWGQPGTPTVGQFASARLQTNSNPISNAATNTGTVPATELRDLHRGYNFLGAAAGANPQPVTTRYSWLLDAGRTNTNTGADPVCSTSSCRVTPGTGVTVRAASPTTVATATNAYTAKSVTYLAETYGNGDATRCCTPTPSTVADVNGTSAANLLRSSTQTQWVVLEWWGTTPPAPDLMVEVFVG